MSPPKLMFLASEDWFVRSHFMSFVRRAVAEGFDTIVAARGTSARADLEAAGARTIELKVARGGLGPLAILQSAQEVRAVLERERPDLTHSMSLKMILLTLLAQPATQRGQVLAVTGRGYLANAPGARFSFGGELVRQAIAARVRGGKAVLLVENQDDCDWVANGKTLPARSVVIAPGAGVDPERYTPHPQPPSPPVRVGLVSRLIYSKGADVAVATVQKLRAQGVDIELAIAGEPDPENPASVSEAELASWRAGGGVQTLGRVTDIQSFWAGVHIACAPSRGGEGLPRTILEAAACGRPVVTTDVPGCRDFVLDGVTGLVAPPGDADALAQALSRLAQDSDLRERLGAAGRARICEAYTETHAADAAARAWRQALDTAAR